MLLYWFSFSVKVLRLILPGLFWAKPLLNPYILLFDEGKTYYSSGFFSKFSIIDSILITLSQNPENIFFKLSSKIDI